MDKSVNSSSCTWWGVTMAGGLQLLLISSKTTPLFIPGAHSILLEVLGVEVLWLLILRNKLVASIGRSWWLTLFDIQGSVLEMTCILCDICWHMFVNQWRSCWNTNKRLGVGIGTHSNLRLRVGRVTDVKQHGTFLSSSLWCHATLLPLIIHILTTLTQSYVMQMFLPGKPLL